MATTKSADDFGRVSDDKLEASQQVDTTPDNSTMSDEPEFTLREQRRIIRRVDRRLVTTLGVMYCISLMDRTNLGQASIAGMTLDLELQVPFRYVGWRSCSSQSPC